MASDPEKDGNHRADQNRHRGSGNSEKTTPFDEEEHEALPAHDDSETDTASHHRDDDDDDEDEGHHKSRHSLDDEADQHHDPLPEGPEGLNTGMMADTEAPPPRSRTQSRASSTRSRPLTVVPRAERRGLFAQLTLIPEVERPYDYSRKTKWTITAIVALAAAGGPIGSNIMYRKYRTSGGPRNFVRAPLPRNEQGRGTQG